MSRPIEPVYLGGPLHGQTVERVYQERRSSVGILDVQPRDSVWSDPVITHLTYQPKEFAWNAGTDYMAATVMIWVDSRLCETGRDRIMRELMAEFGWTRWFTLVGEISRPPMEAPPDAQEQGRQGQSPISP